MDLSHGHERVPDVLEDGNRKDKFKAVVLERQAVRRALLERDIRGLVEAGSGLLDHAVVVLEPRFLYSKRSEVTTGEDSIIELGKAHTIQQGTDVTIIGFGSTVSTIKDAVALGSWSAEVIDLQTLIPWDREAILESVGRTKRLAIVEENPVSFGWGTDIASVVGAELFGTLEAPILRITCPDTPVPFPPDLEARYLPSSAYVASQVSELLETGRLPSHWWEELEVG